MAVSQDVLTALGRVGAQFKLARMTLDITDFDFVNLSFSIAGEDLVLRKWLKDKLRGGTPGFYVDLGAADPRMGSNSYLFYCHGWRGVCVDANSRLPEAYAQRRPRDVFVNCAVGAPGQKLYYAEHKINNGMARLEASPSAFGSDYAPAMEVRTEAVAAILDRHVPPEAVIDFMSVDLEGTEMSALESNDWSKYRPRLIMLETHGIDATRPDDYPAIAYLMRQGYTCVGVMGANALLKRNT